MNEFLPEQSVEIFDSFNGHNSLVSTGKVERVTKSLIIVRSDNGNVIRFRRKDNLQVGYAWPQCCLGLRPAVEVEAKTIESEPPVELINYDALFEQFSRNAEIYADSLRSTAKYPLFEEAHGLLHSITMCVQSMHTTEQINELRILLANLTEQSCQRLDKLREEERAEAQRSSA